MQVGRVGKGQHRPQGIVALMLNRGGRCVGPAIEGSVVVSDIADEREIKSLIRGRLENREIRVVRKTLVEDVEKRVGDGPEEYPRAKMHQPSIRGPGFKHEAGTGDA